ncbi:hypothetical protein [Rhodohalobacter halophilus]|uniref:hypothetical protein n=1 Tax=Rhodohalobacter halophilus TaxID=1812810 RepID=UPI000B0ADCC4|nr:hypothetical protein [Rhodohalobacter halophilus]
MNTDLNYPDQGRVSKAHRWTGRVLLLVVGVEWVFLLFEAQWLSLFLVSLILLVLFSPIIFKRKLQVEIPAEFHLAAVFFTFAALYLGEIQEFYSRVWWWDIALHTTAGLLMGIVGFLLIYLLNESERVYVHLTPGFIAFFAFTFAVMIGTVWEIFEFAMDQLFDLNMQKPMLGDPSGLTDTMWDMIVNAIGASVISLMGWWYLKVERSFFVKEWIRTFIRKNPNLFKEK